jgi:phosphoglycerate dehydrogenase-like enzyme
VTTLVVLSDPRADGVAALAAAGERVRLVIGDDLAALAPHLPEAEIVLTWEHRAYGLLEPLIPRAPALRWVHSKSAGVDSLLTPALLASPATLTNSSGVYSQALAEFALGAILFFAKKMRRMLDAQAHRRWQQFTVAKVARQTVGIVGLGSVGLAVATAARALGMTVLATRRDPSAGTTGLPVDRVYGPDDLLSMLAASDYVVLAAPLTAATRGLIGPAALAAMKPSAYLINVGRGQTVQQAALVAALQGGQIAGAALDVYEAEPLPADSPLYALDNVLLSPHCADHTDDALQACVDLFLANLDRYLTGRPLLNVVDKRAGY